jgi:preprotein translocase subunit SecA
MSFVDTATALAKRLLGTTNESALRRIWPMVQKVRELGPKLAAMDDADLRKLSAALRERVKGGAKPCLLYTSDAADDM